MIKGNIPDEFKARMRAQLGIEADEFFESLGHPPYTSITLNPNKPEGHPKEGQEIPWNSQGRFLKERPSYVFDPHYHAGSYYAQEASSMLIYEVVNKLPLPSGPFCLDLCAAPGGKSIALLESIGDAGFLISNEVIRARGKILTENVRKWGKVNCLSASGHPSSWRGHESLFDLILVDAPCSGEGMFRKEPKALTEWSERNVEFCAQRQSSILSDIAPCIKEGGFLIYSTCTYAKAENEERLDQIEKMGFEPFEFSLPREWGFTQQRPNAVQAYPHRVRGEGFFLSVFSKGQVKEPTPVAGSAVHQKVMELIDIPLYFELVREKNELLLRSTRFKQEIELLEKAGLLVENGLEMGTYKGDDLIPSHTLAMSGLVRDTPTVVLNDEEAIKYLRRETFPIQSNGDGWYLMLFEGSTLGWAKVAAGRMKNHYPKEWMIRKRW